MKTVSKPARYSSAQAPACRAEAHGEGGSNPVQPNPATPSPWPVFIRVNPTICDQIRPTFSLSVPIASF